MEHDKRKRDLLRAAGLLGLGGLVWSTASRPGALTGGRYECERCPALGACTVSDSLQARDAAGVREPDPAAAGRPRLCETDLSNTGER